jgi:hypothetical protein
MIERVAVRFSGTAEVAEQSLRAARNGEQLFARHLASAV